MAGVSLYAQDSAPPPSDAAPASAPAGPSIAELQARLSSTDPKVRIEAVKALGEIATLPALKAVAARAGDADAAVRDAVAIAVGRCCKDPSAEAWLCKRGIRLGTSTARVTLVRGLRDVVTPATAQALDLCLDDADEAVRVAAILALAGHRSRGMEVLPKLETRLKGGTWREKAATIETLASFILPTVGFRNLDYFERERGSPEFRGSCFGPFPTQDPGFSEILSAAVRLLFSTPPSWDQDLRVRQERALGLVCSLWVGRGPVDFHRNPDSEKDVPRAAFFGVLTQARSGVLGEEAQLLSLRASGRERIIIDGVPLRRFLPEDTARIRRELYLMYERQDLLIREIGQERPPDDALRQLSTRVESEEPELRPLVAAALTRVLLDTRSEQVANLTADPDWRVGAAIRRVQERTGKPESPRSPLPLFAARWGEARKAALAKYGGDAQTEHAVADALDWLARHQEEDGSWRCADHVPEHRRIRIPGFDRDDDYVDAGVTGLAVLAFLGAGYTHQGTDAYAAHIKHAIDWFLRIQQPDGMIDLDPARKLDLTYHSSQNEMAAYNHSIPLLALVEAYGMTQDPALKGPIERALSYSANTKDTEHGWSISLRGDDIGPTIYYIMALQIAKAAGFTVTTEMENEVLRYMAKITDLRRGQIRSLSPVPI